MLDRPWEVAVRDPTRLPAMLKVSARARERVRSLATRAGVEPWVRTAYHLVNRGARREALDHEHLRVLLAGSLSADASCIDVGAHDGGVLREIVRCAPRGRHIAYEPLPHLAAALARDYPDVDVRNAALSDHDGEETFLHDRTEPMRSTLHAHAFTDREHATEIRVRVERLDGALPDDYVPALVKIDVEGAEAEVLRGAVETLRRHRPLVVFEHGAGGSSSPSEVYSILVVEADYRIFDLDGMGPYSLSEFEATYPQPTMWNWIAGP
jgi:FkbM family methyltransferase